MQNNNVSRLKCKAWAAARGYKKHPHRNEVTIDGEDFAYVVMDTPECRQLYDNQVGFIWEPPAGLRRKFRREHLDIKGVSRIDNKGVKARQAFVKKEYV